MLNHRQDLGYTFLSRALLSSNGCIKDMLQDELSPLHGLPHYQVIAELVGTTLAEQEPVKNEERSCTGNLQTIVEELLGHKLGGQMENDGEWNQDCTTRILNDVQVRLERFAFQVLLVTQN